MFAVINAAFYKKRMLVFYDSHCGVYDRVSIVVHYVEYTAALPAMMFGSSKI
jgi:hypothetical protein